MEKKCAYKKPDGSKCNAWKLKDDDYCYFHSESKKHDRDLARSRGGQSTKSLSDRTESLIGEVITQAEAQGKKGLQIENIDDLYNWVISEMNYTEDQKTYSRLSLSERGMQLKYAEFLLKVFYLVNIEPRMQELESMLNREGEL